MTKKNCASASGWRSRRWQGTGRVQRGCVPGPACADDAVRRRRAQSLEITRHPRAQPSAARLGRQAVRRDADHSLRLYVRRPVRASVRGQARRRRSWRLAAHVPRMLPALARKSSVGQGPPRALRGAYVGTRASSGLCACDVLGCILTVGGRLPKKAGVREVLGCILTVGGRFPKKEGFCEVLGCILTVQANAT